MLDDVVEVRSLQALNQDLPEAHRQIEHGRLDKIASRVDMQYEAFRQELDKAGQESRLEMIASFARSLKPLSQIYFIDFYLVTSNRDEAAYALTSILRADNGITAKRDAFRKLYDLSDETGKIRLYLIYSQDEALKGYLRRNFLKDVYRLAFTADIGMPERDSALGIIAEEATTADHMYVLNHIIDTGLPQENILSLAGFFAGNAKARRWKTIFFEAAYGNISGITAKSDLISMFRKLLPDMPGKHLPELFEEVIVALREYNMRICRTYEERPVIEAEIKAWEQRVIDLNKQRESLLASAEKDSTKSKNGKSKQDSSNGKNGMNPKQNTALMRAGYRREDIADAKNQLGRAWERLNSLEYATDEQFEKDISRVLSTHLSESGDAVALKCIETLFKKDLFFEKYFKEINPLYTWSLVATYAGKKTRAAALLLIERHEHIPAGCANSSAILTNTAIREISLSGLDEGIYGLSETSGENVAHTRHNGGHNARNTYFETAIASLDSLSRYSPISARAAISKISRAVAEVPICLPGRAGLEALTQSIEGYMVKINSIKHGSISVQARSNSAEYYEILSESLPFMKELHKRYLL